MFEVSFCSLYTLFMYIKSKFLLMHAAAGRRRKKDSRESNATAIVQGQGEGQGQKKYLESSCLGSVISELSLGNYDLAMEHINKGLDSNNDEILSLLELKNIIARLRLKCEPPDSLIGPTCKSNALPHSFSIEMLDVVQKVLRCRTHYEVLRVSHHATYSEVKRTYKRLALRLHPDKNKAPGAEEAFRRINEAADTLTDSHKRIQYNLLTAVGDCFGAGRTNLYANYGDANRDTEEEPDAEFNQERRRSYQPANQRIPQRETLYQTEQLVIGLVASLVFITITLHYLATAPNYSFTPTSTHSVRLVSRNSHVPFFLTPEFAGSQTPKQLQRLEQEVEQVFLTDLMYNCKQERKLRDKLLHRASQGNNRNLQEHALRMATPACNALAKLDQTKQKPLLLNNNSESDADTDSEES